MSDARQWEAGAWRVKKAERSFLELEHVDPAMGSADDPGSEVDFSITAKWDGCSHLYFGQQGTMAFQMRGKDGPDYVHVCNGVDSLDKMIAFLTHARDAAIAHFRDKGSAMDGKIWRTVGGKDGDWKD